MRSYLIVANRTLASPTLAAEVAKRIGAGGATFHVVVPRTPIPHGLTWDEDESEAAVHDALRSHEVDEIILSTLPVRVSRWLGQDVPSKLRRAVHVPVEVVIAPDELAPVTPGGGSEETGDTA